MYSHQTTSNGIQIYCILPSHNYIIIEQFESEDILDISKFYGYSQLSDLSYTTNPLMFYFDRQIIVLANHNYLDLYPTNFIFGSLPTKKIVPIDSSLTAPLTILGFLALSFIAWKWNATKEALDEEKRWDDFLYPKDDEDDEEDSSDESDEEIGNVSRQISYNSDDLLAKNSSQGEEQQELNSEELSNFDLSEQFLDNESLDSLEDELFDFLFSVRNVPSAELSASQFVEAQISTSNNESVNQYHNINLSPHDHSYNDVEYGTGISSASLEKAFNKS